MVRSVSDSPTPELSFTGADDSAERAEQAGWGREQQLPRGRGGQGCREWAGGGARFSGSANSDAGRGGHALTGEDT